MAPISRHGGAVVPRWQSRPRDTSGGGGVSSTAAAAAAAATAAATAVSEEKWREKRGERGRKEEEENVWKRQANAGGGGDGMAVWKWSVVYCMPKDSGKKQRSKRTYFDGFLTLESNGAGGNSASTASSSAISRLTLVDEAATKVASMQTTLAHMPEAGEEFLLEYVHMLYIYECVYSILSIPHGIMALRQLCHQEHLRFIPHPDVCVIRASMM